MTDQPLVSIITPSFNQAGFLDETIRSVLAQDYPRIEHIVVDGGSTDGSVEIIRRHADRIAKWVSEPDEGQSHAINKGFRMATGEIVAWLNSDDLYFPDAVSTAVKRFVDDPGLGLFYGHCVFVDRDGAFVRYFTEVEPYDEFRLRNCSDYIMQPTTFFRRDRLMQIGLLDESLHFAMDWDLWCRFARSGCGVHYEPKLIAATRVYPETKTTAGSAPRLDEIRRVLKRHANGLWPHAKYGFRATEVRRILEQRDLPFFRRLRLNAQLLFLRLGNWRNILYDRRRPNNLYGLRRRTNQLTADARLTWPLYRDARAIELTLRAERKANGTIELANTAPVAFALQGAGETEAVRVALPEQAAAAHVVDVAVRLEHAAARGPVAVLDSVRLV